MSVLRSAVTAAAGLALGLSSPALAGGGVSISSYGQRALLIQGGGQSVLLNPYEPLSAELAARYDQLRPREFFGAEGISHYSCSS